MIADVVTKKPVGLYCDVRKIGKGKCGGVLWRLQLSRLEEGLGHEGYRCEKWGRPVD